MENKPADILNVSQDLKAGIGQVSSFYGCSLTESQVQLIADQSTFRAMKENSSKSHGIVADAIFRKGAQCFRNNHKKTEQSDDEKQMETV